MKTLNIEFEYDMIIVYLIERLDIVRSVVLPRCQNPI